MVVQRRRIGVVLAMVMLINTGCFTFVPVAPSVAPKAGQQVRVQLTPDGMSAMEKALGPGVVAAEGTLVSQDAKNVVVGVTAVQLVGGLDRFWAGQNVTSFPSTIVKGVDVRAIDRGRTRMAVVAASVAVLGIFVLALSGGGSQGSGGPGGGQPPP